MIEIISTNLWQSIQGKARKAKHRKAAVAYVTDASLLPFDKGDVLVTDASDESIAGGRTSARLLEEYLEANVEIYSLASLHAKILVLDDWAVVGSANASANSMQHYVEAAMVCDRPEVVGQVEKLIESFKQVATRVDKDFIKRILDISVVRSGSTPTSTIVPPTPVKTKFWYISVRTDAEYPGNEQAIDSESAELQKRAGAKAGVVNWFWWPVKGYSFPNTAEIGDIVIQSSRPRAKMSSEKGIEVYKHGRIIRIDRRMEAGKDIKIFHCLWAPNYADVAVTLTEFKKLAKRAGSGPEH